MGAAWLNIFFPGTSNDADAEGSSKKLSLTLTEALKTMEGQDSSSDEDSDEQNIIMFEKTASSAGSKHTPIS